VDGPQINRLFERVVRRSDVDAKLDEVKKSLKVGRWRKLGSSIIPDEWCHGVAEPQSKGLP
jgi:hypothetical protein